MTGHELAEHVLVTFFLLRENESKNASRFLFPCKEPRALMTAPPQPRVWDPCSLVGSQALLFTVH